MVIVQQDRADDLVEGLERASPQIGFAIAAMHRRPVLHEPRSQLVDQSCLAHARRREQCEESWRAGFQRVLRVEQPGGSEEHASELPSLMRTPYAVSRLQTKKNIILH